MNDNNIFYIRSGATLPIIRATVVDNNNNTIDLSGASSVLFTMYNNDGKKIDDSDGSMDDAINGKITYKMSTDDTDTVGAYNAYLKITISNGDILYAPAIHTFDVEIVRS